MIIRVLFRIFLRDSVSLRTINQSLYDDYGVVPDRSSYLCFYSYDRLIFLQLFQISILVNINRLIFDNVG